jgi:glycosyltransferase involved in cell wall biosynthesis
VNSEPLVSVVVPVRNGTPYLSEALESLARQSLDRFEVVAVNDGSVDDTGEILDRWAASDPRNRVLHLPAHGLVPALNAGVICSRAPLIARMDADDISHTRRLELQLEVLDRHPEIGVISCAVRFFPRSGVGRGFRIYEDWLNSLNTHEAMARERFVEAPVAHPSVMLRRELLSSAGGYRDNGWPEDHDLWLRLFENGVRFAKLDQPLVFVREHPGRLTRTDPRYSTDAFLRCKARHLADGPLRSAGGVVIWGAGQTGRRLSRHLDSCGVTIDAFVDIDPAKIGRQLHDKPIVSPDELPALLTDGSVVLTAVASRGARDLIRERLNAIGRVEGENYWCVA